MYDLWSFVKAKQMTGSLDSRLETALCEADDERVRYHLRTLQLRVATGENSHLSA